MSHLLYRCLAGSRLYGTCTDKSDWDFFEVYDYLPNKRVYSPTHTIDGELDTTRMSLSTFMLHASRGAHQSLEAMFAPDNCVQTDLLQALRKSYYCGSGTTINLYRRTIKAFIRFEGPRSYKSHRAALRMVFHLRQIEETGRFNPRLSPDQISLATKLSDGDVADFVKLWMGWQ